MRLHGVLTTAGAINENHWGGGEKESLFQYFMYLIFIYLFICFFLSLIYSSLHRVVACVPLDANVGSYACGAVPELQLPYAAISSATNVHTLSLYPIEFDRVHRASILDHRKNDLFD